MKAEQIYRRREETEDGAILEIVIWRVPTPVYGCTHPYKYRFYYGRGGRRDIGYDNERGKGDHRHIGQREERYVFKSIEQLMDDFYQDIDAWRNKR